MFYIRHPGDNNTVDGAVERTLLANKKPQQNITVFNKFLITSVNRCSVLKKKLQQNKTAVHVLYMYMYSSTRHQVQERV